MNTAVIGQPQARPVAHWTPSSPTRWDEALHRYRSVIEGAKRARPLSTRAMANYIVAAHERVHPLFSDQFLYWLDGLGPNDARANLALAVRLEIGVSGADGRIITIGVVQSSGVIEFDSGALDAVERASPFGPAPAEIRSADENVYFQWSFNRDPILGCSPFGVHPYVLPGE